MVHRSGQRPSPFSAPVIIPCSPTWVCLVCKADRSGLIVGVQEERGIACCLLLWFALYSTIIVINSLPCSIQRWLFQHFLIKGIEYITLMLQWTKHLSSLASIPLSGQQKKDWTLKLQVHPFLTFTMIYNRSFPLFSVSDNLLVDSETLDKE